MPKKKEKNNFHRRRVFCLGMDISMKMGLLMYDFHLSNERQRNKKKKKKQEFLGKLYTMNMTIFLPINI